MFEVMLKLAYNNSSVAVHGITRDEARGWHERAEAVAKFLDYLRDGVIVGHISDTNRRVELCVRAAFPANAAESFAGYDGLTLRLNDARSRIGRLAKGFSLDGLCDLFV